MNPKELRQNIIRMKSAGLTYAEMAATLDIPVSLVRSEARKAGLVNVGKRGRTEKLIMWGGQPYTVRQLAAIANVAPGTLRKRITSWGSVDMAVAGKREK